MRRYLAERPWPYTLPRRAAVSRLRDAVPGKFSGDRGSHLGRKIKVHSLTGSTVATCFGISVRIAMILLVCGIRGNPSCMDSNRSTPPARATTIFAR